MLMSRDSCIHDPLLLSLLISSNLIIFLSYTGISGTITWIVSHSPRVPFPAIWWLFASFILSCGGTHSMSFLVFFRPAYYLEAWTCIVTALVSSVTCILVFKWKGKILQSLKDAIRLGQKVDDILHPLAEFDDVSSVNSSAHPSGHFLP